MQTTTAVADLLTASRQAHQHARTCLTTGDYAQARARFQQALSLRLHARDTDPQKQDPAWLDDAVVPKLRGETERRYHRIPGLTLAQVAQQKDAELEAYFRQQLGEATNPDTTSREPEILVPTHWVPHHRCDTCPCNGNHRWINGQFTRACHDCDCADALMPVMPKEDTEAFKQLQKEREARAVVHTPHQEATPPITPPLHTGRRRAAATRGPTRRRAGKVSAKARKSKVDRSR